MRCCRWRNLLPSSRWYALCFFILFCCQCRFFGVHAIITTKTATTTTTTTTSSSSSTTTTTTSTDADADADADETTQSSATSITGPATTTCSTSSSANDTTDKQQQQQQQQQHDEALALEYFEQQRYCTTTKNNNIKENTNSLSLLKQNFKFHGWKWHTAAVMYELEVLRHQAQKLEDEEEQDVQETTMTTTTSITRDKFHQMMDHVLDFTMHGLFRIQTTLFYPWLIEQVEKQETSISTRMMGSREKKKKDDDSETLSVDNDDYLHVKTSMTAFFNIIQSYKQHQHQIESLRHQLAQKMDQSKWNSTTTTRSASNDDDHDDNNNAEADQSSMKTTAETNVTITVVTATTTTLISKMILEVQEIMRLQHLYLIPMIGCITTPWEQSIMNTKILQGLGLWESRRYLVSMHEAILHLQAMKEEEESAINQEATTTSTTDVEPTNNYHVYKTKNTSVKNAFMVKEEELTLFQQEIPYLLRTMMIPRWKRLLYDVVMGMEEEETTS